jgi:hypothetical protein
MAAFPYNIYSAGSRIVEMRYMLLASKRRTGRGIFQKYVGIYIGGGAGIPGHVF